MLRNFTLNHPSLKFWEICTEPDLNLLEYQSRQKQLTDQLKQGDDGDYCSIRGECLPGFLT